MNRGFAVLQNLPEELSDLGSEGSEDWMEVNAGTYTGPSEKMLSILLVNRQIFQETAPIFYNNNTFRVHTLFKLSRLLRNCSASRRVHFTRIEVMHDWYLGRPSTKKAFDLLAQATKLQYLKISTIDHHQFLSSTNPEDVYWVKRLCKLNVPTLEIDAHGGRIETYVKDAITRKASKPKQIKPRRQSHTVSRTYETRSKKAVKSA